MRTDSSESASDNRRAGSLTRVAAGCSGNAVSGAFSLQPVNASEVTLETWLRFAVTPAGFTNLLGDRNVSALLQSFAFLYLTPDRRLRMHLFSHPGPGGSLLTDSFDD